MTRWAAVAALVLACSVSACSSGKEPEAKAEPERIAVMGQVVAPISGVTLAQVEDPDLCVEHPERDGIGNGTQVAVLGPGGQSLGLAELESGALHDGDGWECRYKFAATDVEGGHDIYKVEVAGDSISVKAEESTSVALRLN